VERFSAGRLAIGTVQFGVDYGITNASGQVAQSEVDEIILRALNSGIAVFDTAAGYGNSEEIIGNTLSGNTAAKVVTKTVAIPGDTISAKDVSAISDAFMRSLERLKVPKVYGLLAHHADNVLVEGGEHLINKLKSLQAQGLVEKIGVSVYSGEQIDCVLNTFVPDIVQLPANVFDQRLATGGYLHKLKEKGVEIHARSLFLQGVLLREPKDLPAYFSPILKHANAFYRFLDERNISALEACLGFGFSQREIDHLIVGVTSKKELDEIIAAAEKALDMSEDFSLLALNDPKFVDPTNWPNA
jgi:aryl-alcohol dehydrogenase-like predicted oxidoreductase